MNCVVLSQVPAGLSHNTVYPNKQSKNNPKQDKSPFISPPPPPFLKIGSVQQDFSNNLAFFRTRNLWMYLTGDDSIWYT